MNSTDQGVRWKREEHTGLIPVAGSDWTGFVTEKKNQTPRLKTQSREKKEHQGTRQTLRKTVLNTQESREANETQVEQSETGEIH